MQTLIDTIWNALLTAIVVTLLTALFVAAMPPVYQAKATVRGHTDDMLLLQSADMLEFVARTTKVNVSSLSGWLEQLLEAGGEVDAVTALQQKMTVSPGDQPDWIDIAIEAQDPKVAAILADEIAAAYSSRRTRVVLESQERARAEQLAEARAAELTRHLASDSRLLDYSASVRSLKTEMIQRDQKIEAIDLALSRLDQEKVAAANGETGALTEPGVVRALERVVKAKMKQSGMGLRYGPGHQKSSQMKGEVDQAEMTLSQELKDFEARLNDRMEVHRLNRDELNKEKSRIEAELVSLDRLQLERERLRLLHEQSLATLQGLTDESAILAFAKAVPPRANFGSNQWILLCGTFVASFLLILILLTFFKSTSRTGTRSATAINESTE